MLEQALPGFRKGLASATEAASALARGEIPEDVTRAIQRTSAARALGGGYGGTNFGRNLTLRDLGRTSLWATGEGGSRLAGLGSFARQTFPQFDFTTAFITPQQKLAFDWAQNLAQFNRNLLANQVAAAPDPAMAELGEAFDNFFETWKNIGVGALGGAFGGMGGGSSGSGSSLSTTSARGVGAGASWFGGI